MLRHSIRVRFVLDLVVPDPAAITFGALPQETGVPFQVREAAALRARPLFHPARILPLAVPRRVGIALQRNEKLPPRHQFPVERGVPVPLLRRRGRIVFRSRAVVHESRSLHPPPAQILVGIPQRQRVGPETEGFHVAVVQSEKPRPGRFRTARDMQKILFHPERGRQSVDRDHQMVHVALQQGRGHHRDHRAAPRFQKPLLLPDVPNPVHLRLQFIAESDFPPLFRAVQQLNQRIIAFFRVGTDHIGIEAVYGGRNAPLPRRDQPAGVIPFPADRKASAAAFELKLIDQRCGTAEPLHGEVFRQLHLQRFAVLQRQSGPAVSPRQKQLMPLARRLRPPGVGPAFAGLQPEPPLLRRGGGDDDLQLPRRAAQRQHLLGRTAHAVLHEQRHASGFQPGQVRRQLIGETDHFKRKPVSLGAPGNRGNHRHTQIQPAPGRVDGKLRRTRQQRRAAAERGEDQTVFHPLPPCSVTMVSTGSDEAA